MENKNRKKGQLIEEGIDVFTLDGSKVTLNYLISEHGGQGDAADPLGVSPRFPPALPVLHHTVPGI